MSVTRQLTNKASTSLLYIMYTCVHYYGFILLVLFSAYCRDLQALLKRI